MMLMEGGKFLLRGWEAHSKKEKDGETVCQWKKVLELWEGVPVIRKKGEVKSLEKKMG